MKTLLFSIILFAQLSASFITPYNSDFIEESYSKFDLIYPSNYSQYRDLVAEKIDKTLKIYEKSFGFKLRNRLKVILASDRDQINNGYSTPVYTNKIVLFNGGSSGVDYFSSPFWLDTLIHHELGHTFQLNAQNSKFSQWANSIFGNSPSSLIHIFPNTILPDALLEGNSVLNESLFGIGGRLWSGRAKALFFSGIAQLNRKSFINNHLSFPFMEEKYIVGGFFNLFLYNRFGISKVNSFFKSHSNRFLPLTPLLINSSFKIHFGDYFDELFEEFLKEYRKISQDFRLQKGETISKSDIYYSIDRDENSIFITSSQLNSRPKTDVISKDNEEIVESFERDGGKLFRVNDEFIEGKSSNSEVDLIESGLWRDNKIIDKSRGEVYVDYLHGSWLYIDLNSSLVSPHIWQDDKFIDISASLPLFDNKNSIYYFKQDREKRTLMKNREALFSFKGFYSKIVDIEEDKIYFIGNSKLGSTLFLYQKGEIFRVLDGDNILDGKLLNSSVLILTAVEKDGYRYIKVKIPDNLKRERPFVEEVGDDFRDREVTKLKSKNMVEYSSLSNLEFSELYLESGEKSLISLARILFKDPIDYNSLSLYYSDITDKKYGVSYSNSRYRFNWGISGEYRENSDNFKLFGSGSYKISQMDSVGTSLNLQLLYDENLYEKFEFVSGLFYGDSRYYGDALHSNSYFYLQPILKRERVNSGGVQFGFGKEFFRENYFDFNYRSLLSLKQENLIYPEISGDVDDFGDISLEGLDHYLYPSKSLHKFSGTLSTTLNLSLYSFKLPISLRREQLFMRYNYLLEDREDELRYVYEKVFGAYFELLLLHRFPIPFTVKYIDNSISGESWKFITELNF